ncbi:MAG: HAD-IA family hydrolase [Proteobacteria bacterium]|nr:HAD-IA family hydrolase [Pseudomonadota bacterium]MBU1742322.1 HAD-IA family hydrolase [Pseudomonadota bacterium]
MRRFDPARVRLLLFDLDGTLSDSAEDLSAAMDWALGMTGLDSPGRDAIRKARLGRGIVSQLRAIAAEQGRAAEAERLVTVFRKRYAAHCLDATRAFPDVADTLKNLPHPKAVVTNKMEDLAHRIVAGLGLAPYFQAVIGWQPDLALKPDPELINLALERLGAGPEEALMVGDTLADVAAARAAGVFVAVVGGGFVDLDELRAAGPDLVLERLSDLTDNLKPRRLFGR